MFLAGAAYGVAFHKFKIWPYDSAHVVYQHLSSYWKSGVWAPEGNVNPAPPLAARQEITLHNLAATMPGYRAILAADTRGNGYTAILLDEKGRQLHSWTLGYAALFEGITTHGPHAMKVLPDGSLLVGYDREGILARLDSCARPIWVRHDYFHHSLDQASDGAFWTWRGKSSAYDQIQYMDKLDAKTGKTLEELSLENIINASPGARAIFRIPEGFQLTAGAYLPDGEEDLFHPNDVEELSPELANRFPEFAAGDLLISIKRLSLLAVIDPRTKTIKWWQEGPWHLQHDPDFEPDGRISLFNNNDGRPYSNIEFVDPATREVTVFPSPPESRFHSHSMGKQQLLPNGNRLIVAPDDGRVLEEAPDGVLVWEYNDVVNKDFNGNVANAQWLPADYFSNGVPACKEASK